MLEIVLSQPLLPPGDRIFCAVEIEDVNHDCLCLTTAAEHPIRKIIVRKERSTVKEIVVWTQSCKNAV